MGDTIVDASSRSPSLQADPTPSDGDDAVKKGSAVAREGLKRKRTHQGQPRQLLSCKQCRQRKVKCDRTKPCSACCARGHPRDCEFIVPEGSDYVPIQQSYEIRKLRAENIRLKELLRAKKELVPDASRSPNSSESSQSRFRKPGLERRRSSKQLNGLSFKQRKNKGGDPTHSIYFGSPGTLNIIHDFERLQMGARCTKSITHGMPRSADMYNGGKQVYAFPTMWRALPSNCLPELVYHCLPEDKVVYDYLDAFQRRAPVCAFPHVPDEITKEETSRFLSDRLGNSQKSPDMLALIFASMCIGALNGTYDRCGSSWAPGATNAELSKGDVWMAACKQCLRISSYMNQPTLLGIQALVMLCPYLINSGRFLDVWALFGTIIRLAHSIALHRNPKYLDPVPPPRECRVRQGLWWWIIHMDQNYSTTLGRPIGISGIGDCPPPEQLTTNTTALRAEEFVNRFTILGRQILSSDRLSNSKIDDFTDRIRSLWDMMPEVLRFDESWLDNSHEVPEWPLDAMTAEYYAKIHNLIILLNRQRDDVSSSQASISPPTLNPTSISSTSQDNTPHHSTPSYLRQHIVDSSGQSTPRGRPLVVSSAVSLIASFIFFHERCQPALVCWTMGQMSFNASMILILDALETKKTDNLARARQAYVIFCDLEARGIHKLAASAKTWIGWGLRSVEIMLGEKHQDEATGEEQVVNSNDEEIHSGSDSTPSLPLQRPIDTVMGNTGMFLLEDPGLQTFQPEAFSPFSWGMAGSDLNAVASNTLSREHKRRRGNHSSEDQQVKQRQLQSSLRHHHHHTMPSISSTLHGEGGQFHAEGGDLNMPYTPLIPGTPMLAPSRRRSSNSVGSIDTVATRRNSSTIPASSTSRRDSASTSVMPTLNTYPSVSFTGESGSMDALPVSSLGINPSWAARGIAASPPSGAGMNADHTPQGDWNGGYNT